ncbi:MAG: hypothetical protein P8Y50_05490 [Sulfurovaceae bacterium]
MKRYILLVILLNTYINANWTEEAFFEGFYTSIRHLTGTKNNTDKCWEKYWDLTYKSGTYINKLKNENSQMIQVLKANRINYKMQYQTLFEKNISLINDLEKENGELKRLLEENDLITKKEKKTNTPINIKVSE